MRRLVPALLLALALPAPVALAAVSLADGPPVPKLPFDAPPTVLGPVILADREYLVIEVTSPLPGSSRVYFRPYSPPAGSEDRLLRAASWLGPASAFNESDWADLERVREAGAKGGNVTGPLLAGLSPLAEAVAALDTSESFVVRSAWGGLQRTSDTVREFADALRTLRASPGGARDVARVLAEAPVPVRENLTRLAGGDALVDAEALRERIRDLAAAADALGKQVGALATLAAVADGGFRTFADAVAAVPGVGDRFKKEILEAAAQNLSRAREDLEGLHDALDRSATKLRSAQVESDTRHKDLSTRLAAADRAPVWAWGSLLTAAALVGLSLYLLVHLLRHGTKPGD